ncbi:MAG: serine hydrolase domain-containing protein [bacterium]
MDKIAAAFQEAIQQKVFSGAQALVGRGGHCLYRGAFGTVSHDPEVRAVSEFTLFDIASLTKPVATATLCLLAWQAKRLDLEAQLQDYLPEFRRKESLTVRHLLQHVSGLPAWLPLFETARGKGWTYEQVKEFYLTQLAATPLEAPPGERRIYSDLGFMLLGFLLEEVEGRRLEGLFWDQVAVPLGMTRTMFHPLHHPDRVVPQDIAATEVCPWRGRLLWGEVHDDNAHVLGGAAGHAGLFGTAGDLELFLREILAARHGAGRLLAQEAFWVAFDHEDPRKLGWDTVSAEGSMAGKYFAPKTSVGHLAFTGCSFWLDFADGKYVILLSNRVHPSRDNEAIKEFRPRIHDLLVSEAIRG